MKMFSFIFSCLFFIALTFQIHAFNGNSAKQKLQPLQNINNVVTKKVQRNRRIKRRDRRRDRRIRRHSRRRDHRYFRRHRRRIR